MEPSVFTQPLFVFLEEAFGVTESPSGYFLDSGRSGILGTIDGLSATVASEPDARGGATIAGHCGHVLFLLRFFLAVERGESLEPDWQSSWATGAVTDAEWRALRTDLRRDYEHLVARLRGRDPWPDAAVGPVMLLLTHCAYHLGEIRQRLLWVSAG